MLLNIIQTCTDGNWMKHKIYPLLMSKGFQRQRLWLLLFLAILIFTIILINNIVFLIFLRLQIVSIHFQMKDENFHTLLLLLLFPSKFRWVFLLFCFGFLFVCFVVIVLKINKTLQKGNLFTEEWFKDIMVFFTNRCKNSGNSPLFINSAF